MGPLQRNKMNLYLKTFILYALPISIILFCTITTKAVVQYDPTKGTLYGFPFYWYCEGANSLSWEIDIPSLLIDFILYLIFLSIPFIFLNNKINRLGKSIRIFSSSVLYTVVILALSLKIIVFSWGTSLHFDIYKEYLAIIHYGIHIGFP